MFRRGLLSLTFICLFSLGKAQDIQSIGVPYVENFSKFTYQAGNQNWATTADEHQIIHFGNSEGLLSFNGTSWQLHKIPHNLIVRSVATDDKGKIYTGGFGEIGYWAYDKKAILKYHSLTALIPSNYKLNDEVWKIYIDGERVIFQSFAAILIYQNNKIKVVSNGTYLFLIKVNKQFFVQVLGKGLYELKGERLSFIKGSELLSNTSVLSILPYQDQQLLIGTSNDGLYIFDGLTIKKWNIAANEFLKIYQLNNGVALFNQYFAYGTILNGILIIDKAGNIVQHINKSSGLQNNTVLSLYLDKSQNLWAGLDNGIDRIELNSPLSFFFDKTGAFGTVYSSIIFKGKIYLGTNQGLFYSTWDSKNKRQLFDFKLIPKSQGQVWDLSVIDGELYCGHNSGTFKIDENNITLISNVSGGWAIKKMHLQPNMLIQGTYTGLVIYKKATNGKYYFSHKVAGFSEPSRYVEQDAKGNIWVSQAYKGLYKINLSKDLKTVAGKVKSYDEKSGLPSNYEINTFNLDGKIIFSSDDGFFVYDDISDKFKKYEELNSKLGSFAYSNKVIKAENQKYWFIEHGKAALADFTEEGKIKVDSTLFSIISGRMVQDYENISRIDQNLYLISVDDGFVLYNQKIKIQNIHIPTMFIAKVDNIAGVNFTVTESGSLSKSIHIKYAENSIRINYALPYYRQAKIKYQYYLKGFSTEWSTWSPLSQKDFTNLPYGSYEFKVRALVNDRDISSIAIFNFEVLPPFYARIWAWMIYLILLVIGGYCLRQWYFNKLKNHQLKIALQLQQERDEHLKQDAFVNEQKLIKLKTEKLQAEVESKSREVTNSAMNMVYKNELLQKIKDEIAHLKDAQGKKIEEDQLKRLQKIIDEGMNDERDWNLFETSFNETHENFFKKLKSSHPDLVPNDLKLCAYLRMNMSSKEMASLLNISLRGVEIRRYRLRKKLDISHDKNLVEFLIEL